MIAGTENFIYEVNEKGEISEYKSSVKKDNRRYFLDRLKNHIPNFIGTLEPKDVATISHHAQWLDGIAAGAWFELYFTGIVDEYRFKRVSPHGNIDVDGLYKVNNKSFNYKETYSFVHYSNCAFYHIEQQKIIYRFDLIKRFS